MRNDNHERITMMTKLSTGKTMNGATAALLPEQVNP
jgi:hypothetical protein